GRRAGAGGGHPAGAGPVARRVGPRPRPRRLLHMGGDRGQDRGRLSPRAAPCGARPGAALLARRPPMTVTDLSTTQAAVARQHAGAGRAGSVLLILLTDAVLVNLAFWLGFYVRYNLQLFRQVIDSNDAPYSAYIPFQVAYTILMLLFLFFDGAYRQRR